MFIESPLLYGVIHVYLFNAGSSRGNLASSSALMVAVVAAALVSLVVREAEPIAVAAL